MREIVLASAREAQLEELLEMMEAFNHHELIPWTREQGRGPLQHLMAHGELGAVRLIVDAEEPAQVYGYAILTWGFDLEWGGRDAFLTELYVSPSWRGHGLGKRALALVQELAREQGARALHLMVRTDNTPALSLYLSEGFTDPERLLLTKPL